MSSEYNCLFLIKMDYAICLIWIYYRLSMKCVWKCLQPLYLSVIRDFITTIQAVFIVTNNGNALFGKPSGAVIVLICSNYWNSIFSILCEGFRAYIAHNFADYRFYFGENLSTLLGWFTSPFDFSIWQHQTEYWLALYLNCSMRCLNLSGIKYEIFANSNYGYRLNVPCEA